MQSPVRAMLEGALISGIFLVMTFLTLYTPIGFLISIALPIPFTVYATRHPLRKAILVIVASSLLTIFIGALPSVLLSLFAGLLGTVMGTLYRRQKSAIIVFMGGLLTSLIFLLGSLVVIHLLLGINPLATIQATIKESLDISDKLMNQFDMSNSKQVQTMKEMIELIPQIAPMLLIFAAAQIALLNHWLSRKVLVRLGNDIAGFPVLRNWRWPQSVFYIYLVVTIVSIFFGANQEQLGYMVVINLKPIIDVMIMIQGLSLISYISYQKGWGKGLLIFTIILLFIFPAIPFILVIMGLLDLGVDVRKPFSKK